MLSGGGAIWRARPLPIHYSIAHYMYVAADSLFIVLSHYIIGKSRATKREADPHSHLHFLD